ncbi:MAG: hypothetical protein O7F73_14950 [Gammaproteobacteria bacterium]|nr:hypothetical protein [Gammaproteobacteria bacterium]
MKMIYRAVLAAAITVVAAPSALAGLSTSDAVGVCKAQAGVDLAPQGVDTRIKFRGTGRKSGATEVRLQLYPKGMESFKATCSLDRKTGEIISLAREGDPADAVVQTAGR